MLKFRKHILAFFIIGIILILVINVYINKNLQPILDMQLLIGHRGGNYGVENTIETVMFAGDNGADYVEIDVLLTKDNVPVVIHDNDLIRLANIPKKISDMTLDEVMDVTIKGEEKEDKIPSLEELAKEVKGEIKLLLEFKTHGKEKISLVDKTIEILENQGILEDTIFQTAEYEIIEEFNEKYKDLTMGYVSIEEDETFSANEMSKMPVDFISAEASFIDKNVIIKIHNSGKAVFAWTINDDSKAENLLELGVDGIITDYPLEMIKTRDKYKDSFGK